MAAAGRNQAPPSMEEFEAFFKRADLDHDGRISGAEAVAFFQGSNLSKNVLAQIWMHADQNRIGFLGRQEFYNALKLVTVAQNGHELKPDIIKAALYSPAAARIPAPKINPVSPPVVQLNSVTNQTLQSNSMVRPSSQIGVMGPTASQNLGFMVQQAPPIAGANTFLRPAQATPAVSLPVQGVGQGLPGVGSVFGPRLSSSNAPNLSTDWFGVRTSATPAGVTSQIPVRGPTPSVGQDGSFVLAQLGTAPGVTPKSQASLVPASSVRLSQPSLQPASNDSKALVLSGNGFSTNSIFGGDEFSATQTAQGGFKPTFPATSMPNSSSNVPVSAESRNTIKPGQPNHFQDNSRLPPAGSQLQTKQNQLDAIPSTSALAVSNVSVGPVSSAPSQSQLPWPKITQSDIKKYTNVFIEVDKDRDGKITGEEARNLFLSWRLPREVLKQVWDLSDQDNDSMLSLRDFCTALYLMERYREGRPLPAVLPNSLKFDETLLLATSQPSNAYAAPVWQPRPGLLQHGIPGSQHVIPSTGGKPPRQTPTPSQTDSTLQPVKQKSKVPVLEKHLVNQLSNEEQGSLNSKFQEAADADKKVQELEKEILDSREKIEFYRTKMQELVLYKSKCDNRLNEIMERASSDKREVESLANKYESKYKQVGDVASKLTMEEATFRDIQEKKLELLNAIVKMKQGGQDDTSVQVHADVIQSDLNDLVKALNERCKQYGLRAKPTSLTELPFGWQPGIQEGSSDWDEEWDKFEEGFTVIKELTVEVENVVSTAKMKPSSEQNEKISKDEEPFVASSNGNSKIENPSIGEQIEIESASGHSEDISAKSPVSGLTGDKSTRSPPGSPRGGAVESPSLDLHSTQHEMHDMSPRAKETHSDHDGAESSIFAEKSTDERPWSTTFDAGDDFGSSWKFNALNLKETDGENREHDLFRSGGLGLNPIRIDSPSGSSVSGKQKTGPFFDSVPSTPLFNSATSPRYSEGPEEHSFSNLGRYDSFNMNDGGLFTQMRFDSLPSGKQLTRYDSVASTADNNRDFPSFDDFAPTGPFKSRESHTPKHAADNWSAF